MFEVLCICETDYMYRLLNVHRKIPVFSSYGEDALGYQFRRTCGNHWSDSLINLRPLQWRLTMVARSQSACCTETSLTLYILCVINACSFQ